MASIVRHPRRSAALFSLLTVLLAATPALAINLNEWVPGLKFSPFITERASYQTNIFQEPVKGDDALELRTIPGFTVDLERGPLLFSTGYRAEFLNFIGLDDPQQDTVHHIAFLTTRLEMPRLTARLSESFAHTSDPPSSSDLVGRIENTTNVLAPEIEYKITPRLSAGVKGGWTHVNFDRTNEALDRNEYAAGTSAFWRVFPNADVRLGYTYTMVRFVQSSAETRDSNQHEIVAGVRGDLTPKLSSTLSGGYAIRDSEGNNDQDASALTLGGDLVYRLTDRTKFSLLASRRFEETTFGASTSAGYFVSTNGTFLVDQQFTPKLSANARFTASTNDYPTNEPDPSRPGTRRFRNDVILGWGGGLEYEIQKWLQVGAEYAHTRRDSNFNTNDYQDDRFTGKVTLIF